MKDKEYAIQRKRIEALSDKWIHRLGLKWWRIHINYYDTPLPDLEYHPKNDNDVCLFQTFVHWQYLEATIKVDLSGLVDRSDDDVEEWFLHECMHILLNEARQMNQEDWLMHEERLASTFARTYMWTEQAVIEECKKKGGKAKCQT